MNAIIGKVVDCDAEEKGGYPQVLRTRVHAFRADVGKGQPRDIP